MASTKWTEHYFRKALKDEREARHLTQPELAEVFKANGLDLHWSTIAKIENGDRSVRIDEAARIADVFETSVDAMLGRPAPGDTAGDPVARELARLVYTAHKAQEQIQSARVSLAKGAFNMRITANWQPQGSAAELMDACMEACSILGPADQLLSEALAKAEVDLSE